MEADTGGQVMVNDEVVDASDTQVPWGWEDTAVLAPVQVKPSCMVK